MIQPTSNFSGSNRPERLGQTNPQIPLPQPPAESVGDNLSASNTDTLRAALKDQPEIRPEVVERGKSLAVDIKYPPLEIINSLAKLMTESADLTEQE
ncbi:MAG TPA: hypothetical protein VFT72_18190 [Opitutaceae bacterium]|nr:hypothetical protein [Opitutaceae bacterium]